MSPTPDITPDDAIIPISYNDSISDPVYYIVGVLRDEWNPANTDGRVPRVDFAEATKDLQFAQEDYIVVYTTSVFSEPVTITYAYKNEDYNFTLDVFTSKDRRHLTKLINEIERIIENHRADTFGGIQPALSGRQWLQIGQMGAFEKTAKGHYHRTIDGVLHFRYRRIRD